MLLFRPSFKHMAHDVRTLLSKYLQDTLTAEEAAILFDAVNAGELTGEALPEELFAQAPFFNSDVEVNKKQVFERLLQRLDNPDSVPGHSPAVRHLFRRRHWVAAAILFLILASGAYFWFSPKSPGSYPDQVQADIAPAREGAYLTLADGSRILLDSAGNGKLTDQGEARLVKTDGRLSYSGGQGHVLAFNTLTTPRGRVFQVILGDGTRVWLNAASSITYPVAFPDSIREVSITGEAYFEVSGTGAPFRVRANGMDVDVLGTHFNVSAYGDDSLQHITLIEGSVRVRNTGGEDNGVSVVLRPGEQAGIAKGEKQIRKSAADTEEALGWKNNLFWFNHSDIAEVMRQLARWYDIEVVMEDEVDFHFSGTLPRNANLSTVLRTLELTKGVKFRIEEKKVTVLRG